MTVTVSVFTIAGYCEYIVFVIKVIITMYVLTLASYCKNNCFYCTDSCNNVFTTARYCFCNTDSCV